MLLTHCIHLQLSISLVHNDAFATLCYTSRTTRKLFGILATPNGTNVTDVFFSDYYDSRCIIIIVIPPLRGHSHDAVIMCFLLIGLATSLHNFHVHVAMCTFSQDCMQDNGFAPIHTAVSNNNVSKVEALVKRDAKLRDYPTAYGETPISIGCLYGCCEVVRSLHRCGASLECRTPDGTTAVHYASASGSPNTLKYVLGEGQMKDYVNSTNKVLVECLDITCCLAMNIFFKAQTTSHCKGVVPTCTHTSCR